MCVRERELREGMSLTRNQGGGREEKSEREIILYMCKEHAIVHGDGLWHALRYSCYDETAGCSLHTPCLLCSNASTIPFSLSIAYSWYWRWYGQTTVLQNEEGLTPRLPQGKFPWQPGEFLPRRFHPWSSWFDEGIIPSAQTGPRGRGTNKEPH